MIFFSCCGTAQTAEEKTNESAGGTLSLLVDASYKISHGWGHVFRCTVKDVLHGELTDTTIYLSVYGTVDSYGELLLPFNDYYDLILSFVLNPERNCGPPPGFRDSRDRYWELRLVIPAGVLTLPLSLSDVFPGWRDCEGKASIYELDTFPDIQYHHYTYPDVDSWIRELNPCKTCDDTTGYIQVWHENGDVRFIWITYPYPNGGKFYSFKADTIDMCTPINPEGQLFMTEVGINKWRFIYSEGLLDKIVYYRTNTFSPVWAVDIIEYWPAKDIPKRIFRYVEPSDLDVCGKDWDSRIKFDRTGKRLRKVDRD